MNPPDDDSPPERGASIDRTQSASIQAVIEAKLGSVVGLGVRRALPTRFLRRVGPFTFLDHMGPARLGPGQGVDVRPHPHIGLATLTYLFEGEFTHRDSLGNERDIRPGDVNWMLAGRGIVHSERTSSGARALGGALHGVQCWVALPTEHEEDEPSFTHHPKATIPHFERHGVQLSVLAGTAWGHRSPVNVLSQTLYVHACFTAGTELELETEHAERAVYVAEGELYCDGRGLQPGQLAVFHPGAPVTLRAEGAVNCVLLGGAPLLGERFMDWNFVSSSKERLERAKDDWRQNRFPLVPGDERERIELP